MSTARRKKHLVKSVNVRPLGETSVSRVYFFRRQSSLCYSDALSGLLDFFSSLRLHTHRPPPSLQCVSSPPPPSSCPEHPECNSSLCLHCFRALPSSAHQTAELPDCLPRARLVHTEWECESHYSSAELSDRNAAQWPRRDTT